MPAVTQSAVREQDPPRRTEPSTRVRTDIQGLRALAVSLVLLFHLWPRRLTGGFVGVDVFFVISGFLITSHLLAHPPRRARDLAEFWARRIQRLLPASLLVLAVTAAATWMWAPETTWGNTAEQIRTATLYYVNWLLASTSVDYLAAENAPSPAQHYWSLSIEEQFYLGWPVLLLVLFLLARLLRRAAAPIVVGGIASLVAASLWWSVSYTATEPAQAYFVTPTRIWELGLGGLLAALLSRRAFGRNVDHEHVLLPEPARIAIAWAGFAAIGWSAYTYSGATAFPGWLALVPVLGTVAVIAVDAPRRAGSPGPLLAWRPVQFLGDISYSVYLWHWPLIVLMPYATGHVLTRGDKLGIVAATLVLATLTKYLVEDRFREARFRRPLVKPYVAMLVAMGLVVGLSAGLNSAFERKQEAARDSLAAALENDDPCFGARSLARGVGECPASPAESVVPAPALAPDDKSDAYADGCWSYLPRFPDESCDYGPEDADVTIALVGNSHAGQWLPALQQAAEQEGWGIRTYLASRCAMSDLRQKFDTADKSSACLDWVHRTRDRIIADEPDLVVISNRISVPAEEGTFVDSRDDYLAGYQSVLAAWADAGLSVLALHDTPAPVDGDAQNVPDCLAATDLDIDACSGRRADWEPDDPITDAVAEVADPRVQVAELNDLICLSDQCPAVVGGVVVYFDGSHLTATYSSTLGPFLAKRVRASLSRSARG